MNFSQYSRQVAPLGYLLLSSVCALAALGCSDKPGGSGGPEGGTSGEGSGSGGSGASADQVSTGEASTFYACREYVIAQCQRVNVCLETDTVSAQRRCVEETSLEVCPAALFSEGSNQSVATALACAETWKTYSCEALLGGERPECSQMTGSMVDGQPCLYQSQCENECTSDTSTCGECAPRAQDACDAGQVCAGVGSICKGGVCESLTDQGYPEPEDEIVSAGAMCLGSRCAEGYVCFAEEQDALPICLPALQSGDSCYSLTKSSGSTSYACGGDLFCHGDTLKCTEAAAPDEPCLRTAGHEVKCREGSICDTGTICRSLDLLRAGAACLHPVTSGAPLCSDGQICEEDVCVIPLGFGESGCEATDHGCGTGLRCESDVCVEAELPDDSSGPSFEQACGL